MHSPFVEGKENNNREENESPEPSLNETPNPTVHAELEVEKAKVSEARTNSPRFGGKLEVKESTIISAEVDLAATKDAFGN